MKRLGAMTSPEALRSLADPTRLAILRLLRRGEMSAGELADRFDLSKPSMSHHFAVLKQADLIAVDLHDPLERTLGNVGLLAMEDPESGEVVWVDTGNKAWRAAFQQRVDSQRASAVRAMRHAGVDRIDVATNQDYVAPLAAFFQERYRRIRH